MSFPNIISLAPRPPCAAIKRSDGDMRCPACGTYWSSDDRPPPCPRQPDKDQ